MWKCYCAVVFFSQNWTEFVFRQFYKEVLSLTYVCSSSYFIAFARQAGRKKMFILKKIIMK